MHEATNLCSMQVYLKGRARRHANTEETVANADFVMDSNSSVTYGKITHQARQRSSCCSCHGKVMTVFDVLNAFTPSMSHAGTTDMGEKLLSTAC